MNIKDITKTKTYMWCRYIVINAIFATAIYFGLFLGITGAENLALFMAWITGILGTLLLIGLALDKDGAMEESLSRSEPSPVPFWFDFIFDIGVSLAFIWTGHYMLVIFYIFSIAAGKAIRDVPKNVMLKKLKSQQS